MQSAYTSAIEVEWAWMRRFNALRNWVLLLPCDYILKFDWYCQLSGSKSNSLNSRKLQGCFSYGLGTRLVNIWLAWLAWSMCQAHNKFLVPFTYWIYSNSLISQSSLDSLNSLNSVDSPDSLNSPDTLAHWTHQAYRTNPFLLPCQSICKHAHSLQLLLTWRFAPPLSLSLTPRHWPSRVL